MCCVLCLVAQSCPTLCNPMACSPPGSSVHGNSLSKNTEVGCHALLQGIFPTQVLNPALLHGRRMLYCRATREASPHYFSLSGLSPAHSLSDEPPCSSLDTITCFLLEALALAFPSFGMLQVFAWSLPSGHSRLPVQNCRPHPNATLSLFISLVLTTIAFLFLLF